jgi:hypothetical protein
MEYTKEQRKEIYIKSAFRLSQMDLNDVCCCAIAYVIDYKSFDGCNILDGDYTKNNFPELWSFKPQGKNSGERWFDDDLCIDAFHVLRLNILLTCAEMCND